MDKNYDFVLKELKDLLDYDILMVKNEISSIENKLSSLSGSMAEEKRALNKKLDAERKHLASLIAKLEDL